MSSGEDQPVEHKDLPTQVNKDQEEGGEEPSVGDGGATEGSASEVAGGEEQTESDDDTGSLYDLEPFGGGYFRMAEEVNVDPAIVQQLSSGFLQRFLPSLEESKSSITEILSNQTVLIDTLEQENSKFKECVAYKDLATMMTKAKNYHNKLLNIKRDMTSLHDKAGKLKKRALKLQQLKQKEELQRAHQHEREMEKDQLLNARVASSSTSES